uniref:IS30 family transposase n=1 Tax=Octadecabacter antarcticus TaxID=1217908 RepID=UPI001FDFB749|nr:IS30 family transposase [Octadecabacter antarcticus]
MKRLPVALRRSMTYDRGSDPLMVCEQTTAGQWMACHPELSRRLKVDIWFCDPHTPWQRGSNKNTNGLLRQFFPKGTDLGCLSQAALNDVARLMNDRPRKTLGWRTPAEAMAEDLTAIKTINRRTSILDPSSMVSKFRREDHALFLIRAHARLSCKHAPKWASIS